MTNSVPIPNSREAQFLAALPTIERVLAFVARRHRLSPDAAEEFAASVRLKFVERNYELLSKFEGRSSLATFLSVVIQRLFLDHRIAAWGKWRPSAEARRLGPLAIRLERLQTRDRLTFDEACESILADQADVSRRQLDEIAVRLPHRPVRRFETEDVLEELPAAGAEADRSVSESERLMAGRKAAAGIQRALAQLEPQDQIALRMRFREGFTIARIARTLDVNEKALYRRFERLLSDLKGTLEKGGLSGEAVRELLDESSEGLSLAGWDRPPESPEPGPSTTKGASA